MDTKTGSLNTDNIVPFVLLHQARRDRALGLTRPGARTLALGHYWHKRQAETIDRLAQAAFLRGVIAACKEEVRALIEGADTPDKRRSVLGEAQRLNEVAQVAIDELEAMNDG